MLPRGLMLTFGHASSLRGWHDPYQLGLACPDNPDKRQRHLFNFAQTNGAAGRRRRPHGSNEQFYHARQKRNRGGQLPFGFWTPTTDTYSARWPATSIASTKGSFKLLTSCFADKDVALPVLPKESVLSQASTHTKISKLFLTSGLYPLMHAARLD